MKKMILVWLFVASGLGCRATTPIGSTDAGCNVTLPKTGFYGPNILYPGNDSLVSFASGYIVGEPVSPYELVVDHDADAAVTVTMTLLSGYHAWQINGQATDWRVGAYGSGTQTFGAPGVSGEFEESLFFFDSGQARVDLFECNASSATLSKTISWAPSSDAGTGG